MTDILLGLSAEEAERLLADSGTRFEMLDCLDRKTDTDGQKRVARVTVRPDGVIEVVCMYFHNDIYGA